MTRSFCRFLHGYACCTLLYALDDMDTNAWDTILTDARAFYDEHIDRVYECERLAGRSFWLTRNGFTGGFDSGAWHEPAATLLFDTARAFGPTQETRS